MIEFITSNFIFFVSTIAVAGLIAVTQHMPAQSGSAPVAEQAAVAPTGPQVSGTSATPQAAQAPLVPAPKPIFRGEDERFDD